MTSGARHPVKGEWKQGGFIGFRWALSLGILSAVLWICSICLPNALEWMSSITDPKIPPDAWWCLLALYPFMALITHLVVYTVLLRVRRLLDLKLKPADIPLKYWKAASFVGLCESVLYPTSWLIGKPEFIGVWLVLKAAGAWQGWQATRYQDMHIGRNRFQAFLIGNALSVFFGFVAYGLMRAVIPLPGFQ